MDRTNVPHNNYVGDSILGQECNLGAGTKVANLRLDGKNIIAILKGRPIDTGLRKLGVIMGDEVKTGINSSIDPGTIMGQNSYLGPNALACGSIAPRSRIH
jgi:bifunctional UDP-N-acetylglucosamine pyrophosphorylase/glucosamine-1-phosphate N-acetyltransferase